MKKRRIRDISCPVLEPFSSGYRDKYEIVYQGVADETVGSYVCHYFTVTSKGEQENDINGEYYFEAASFHLVRVDFSPAKLPGGIMFRLGEVNMSILYGPIPEGFWLPKQFEVRGQGKRALFFKLKFAGTEYYRNPIINSGVRDDIFEVSNGK